MLLSRVVGLVGVLFGVSLIIFVLGQLAPGDIATIIAGQGASAADVDAIRERLGLNAPLIVQYLTWMGGVLRGDFGTSPISGRPVADALAQQVPVSLEVTVLSIVVSTLIGVTFGVISSARVNPVLDALVRGSLLVLFSIPVFVVGVVLLLLASLYVPGLQSLGFTPFTVDPVANLTGMVLPVLSVALPISAMSMQMTRTSMDVALKQEYVAFAKAKGVGSGAILSQHALKNAFSPVLTQIGFTFGILMGGIVVVENIFNLPGLGRGLMAAIQERDFTTIMAQSLVLAAIFVTVNTIVDFLYPVFDPRQKVSQ
ncbi:MAG: ABC transporter permease [Microbacterium sp.]